MRTAYIPVDSCSSLCFYLFQSRICLLSLLMLQLFSNSLARFCLHISGPRMRTFTWNRFPIQNICWLIRLRHFCGDWLPFKGSILVNACLSRAVLSFSCTFASLLLVGPNLSYRLGWFSYGHAWILTDRCGFPSNTILQTVWAAWNGIELVLYLVKCQILVTTALYCNNSSHRIWIA